MTLFEYLTVAVSIVLSMGIVRLVDCLRPAIRAPARYWVHVIWVLIKLYSHAMYWWVLWGYRGGVEWNFPYFLYVLGGPVLLYLQVSMLVPPRPEDVPNWRERYFEICQPFFLINILFLIHGPLGGLVISGSLPPTLTLVGLSTAIALNLAAILFRQPRLHEAVALASLALVAAASATTLLEPLSAV